MRTIQNSNLAIYLEDGQLDYLPIEQIENPLLLTDIDPFVLGYFLLDNLQ